MTKWTAYIILLGGLFLAACAARSLGSPSSTPDAARSPASGNTPVSITTDREAYRAGESILVAIENHSTEPIQFMGLCSLHLCQKSGEEWVCEERECQGPPIVLEPGSQMALVMEASIFNQGERSAEGNSRYKLDYQITSQIGISFAHSERFTIQSAGLNCAQARKIAQEYAQSSPHWNSLEASRAFVRWQDEDRACLVDFAWQGAGEIRPGLWSEGYIVVINPKSGRVKEAYAYER